MNTKKIEEGIKLVLEGLQVDLADRSYAETPQRVARMMHEMFRPKEASFPEFEEAYGGIILARNYIMYSLCKHHLTQIKLNIDIAYVPGTHVYGLSKLARIATRLNTGPMLQEQYTRELAEEIYKIPNCKGSAVMIKGNHGCMSQRGIRTQGDVITCLGKGIFESPEAWNNFLLLRKS